MADMVQGIVGIKMADTAPEIVRSKMADVRRGLWDMKWSTGHYGIQDGRH